MDILAWVLVGVLAVSLALVYGLALRPAQVRLREVTAELQAARAEAQGARAGVEAAQAATSAAQVSLAQREAQLEAAQRQVEDIKANREELANQFKALSAEVLKQQTEQAKADADERLKATETVLAPVKENLDKLQAKLGEVELQRAKLQAELNEQVRTVKSTSDELRKETSALATALRKPQTRGAWGELQLQNVVEAAGMKEHVDFNTQHTSESASGAGIRPDLKVMMGEGRFIFVDAKVPMAAFLDALEKTDEAERANELKRVAKHVRAHIDQLSAKEYFTADSGTPEFVVLFIPHEAMAAEALYSDPTLHEYAFAKNIVLATPTSLVAMLKTVNYAWQQNALAEHAQMIAALGAELYKRIGVLGGHFAKLGKSLERTVDSYNDAVGSLERNVITQARRMHDYGIEGKELDELPQVLAEPKPLTKAEVVPAALDELPLAAE
ncbi:MAG: DNA recombination protein RmuC [Propionibacteriaceae bacterium]|jgi:DNA recombination protein RmuC|nr:DNA recombination protein RmuC [Propionibacteriaceae bacterium]